MDLQIISSSQNLPYRIEIKSPSQEEQHIHPELELVFILKGSVEYSVDYKKYILNQRDFFFVNSLELHHINSYSSESRILCIHIDLLAFTRFYPGITDYPFQYRDTLNNREHTVYKNIYAQLHTLLYQLVEKPDTFLLLSMSCITNILIELCESCINMQTSELYVKKDEKRTRIINILSYLNENYSETITLDMLSEKFSLSKPYLSKYFKTVMGTGFLDYVNRLRIHKSLDMLCNTEERIIDIALANGFNTQKSYSRVFQKEFGQSPSEYRTKNRSSKKSPDPDLIKPVTRENLIQDFPPGKQVPYTLPDEEIRTVNIGFNLKTAVDWPLKQIWNRTLFLGSASLCLHRKVQNEIRELTAEIPFQYIRFYGIFSDDIFFCRESKDGTYTYFWEEIDELLDFICNLSLKPFFVFGPSCGFFATKRELLGIVPQNYAILASGKKWGLILSDFCSHCIERYGRQEVNSWKFQVWSLPSEGAMRTSETAHDFFRFMKKTYLTIRQILPQVQIGSPALLPDYEEDWLDSFFTYCREEHIQFDFMNVYLYTPTNPLNLNHHYYASSGLTDADFTDSQNYFNESTLKIIHCMQRNQCTAPLIASEWNINDYPQDYCRDTVFMLSYLLHTHLNAPRQIDEIIYSLMQDYPNELIPSGEAFYGGPGFLTAAGLKKPVYTGLWFLNQLGDKEIFRGDSYIITRSGEQYQFIFYNYRYFSKTFLSGDKDLLSSFDRYNIYEKGETLKLNLVLNLESGNYKTEAYLLDRLHGSVYDAWMNMGHPDSVSGSVHKYLKSKDSPHLFIETKQVKENLLIEQDVPVHGAVLLLIEKLS